MIKNQILHKTNNDEDNHSAFEKAKEKKHLRDVDLKERIKSLRMMFVLIFILSILVLSSFFFLIKKPLVVPYIVEISPTGNVVNYGKMGNIENHQLSNITIKKCIIDFLYNIRRIDNDIIVIKRNWQNVYYYASKNSKKILDKMFSEINPLENYKNYLVDIKIISYLDKSTKAKEIEFLETKYSHSGAVLEKRKYRCLLTFVIRSEFISENNPEGFLIDSFVIGEIK